MSSEVRPSQPGLSASLSPSHNILQALADPAVFCLLKGHLLFEFFPLSSQLFVIPSLKLKNNIYFPSGFVYFHLSNFILFHVFLREQKSNGLCPTPYTGLSDLVRLELSFSPKWVHPAVSWALMQKLYKLQRQWTLLGCWKNLLHCASFNQAVNFFIESHHFACM